MVKCCIFDLDGTLLNTLGALSYCISRTMNELGYGDIDEEHTKIFVGEGYKEFVRRALIYSGDTNLKHFETASEIYLEIFEKYSMRNVRPYPGMEAVLKNLRSRGIRLAVLTNKPQERAEENIFNIFGKDIFERVCGEREGILLKPDPGSLNQLIADLGINKEEVLYFGDTSTDMQTGKNAAVKTVGVLWGFRSREELENFQPDHLIMQPEDIEKLI